MEVICCAVGKLQTNCYIAYDPVTKKGIVVDPGDHGQKLLSLIEEHALTITHIFLTHGHFDHIYAVSRLKRATGAAVCIHTSDAEMLLSEEACLGFPGYIETEYFTPVSADILLHGGETIEAAGEKFLVHHTPGHTRGSVCYDTGAILFAGDTLFANSCGRCDLPGGNPRQMLTSLLYLSELSGDRIVYPGHESNTTLDKERRINYAMRQAVSMKQCD